MRFPFALAHLPSLLILIGYAAYALQLTLAPSAYAQPWAATCWGLIALGLVWRHRRWLWARTTGIGRLPLATLLFVALPAALLLLLTAWAAGGPLYLNQEYDALHYHYGLPRQHWIAGSWAHLPWSVADLWWMPLQYAFAPYRFATSWPNKLPQFLCLVGLLAVLCRRNPWVAVAVLASHGFTI